MFYVWLFFAGLIVVLTEHFNLFTLQLIETDGLLDNWPLTILVLASIVMPVAALLFRLLSF